MTRIFIVEDSAPVRERIERKLRAARGLLIVGVAATLAEAERLLPVARADVILLDLRLPDGIGIDLIKTVRKRKWPAAVVVLTNHCSESYERASLQAGADAFLSKQHDFENLIAEIERIAERSRNPEP